MKHRKYLFIVGISILGVYGQDAWGVSGKEAVAWLEDLDVLTSKFVVQEKSFNAESKSAYLESIEAIRAELNRLDDDHILVRVMQAVALAGNAHTSVFLSDYGPIRERLPIRLYSFSDGFYVVKARPSCEDLLGKRVVGIGQHSIGKAHAAVATLFYGNKSWRRYNSLYPLVTPSFLYGLDLIDSTDSVTLTVQDESGRETRHILKPEPLTEEKNIVEPWWHMTSTYDSTDTNWKHVLDLHKKDAPLYLKNPNECFWFTTLRKQKTLYVQYNISQRPREIRSSRILKEMKESVAKMGLTTLIFDLRMNTGGDFTLMRGLFDRIMKIEPFNIPGSTHVITGPATFSAGIFHAANIKTQGGIVSGELVGDDLDFWAEGGSVTLPNSKVVIYTNNGFHSYSKEVYPELEKFVHTNLDIDTLEPEIPAALTFADFLAKRDPVLDAIFQAN